MSTEQFFAQQSPESRVKAEIVSKFFWAWANVLTNTVTDDVAYLDLFAGAGMYDDGAQSTPLLVLQQILDTPRFRDRIRTIFNEKENRYADRLESAIKSLPNISALRHEPLVLRHEVDHNHQLFLKEIGSLPALLFVDPWGYKGVTLDLLTAFMKSFGRDCLVFINYPRINRALGNDLFEHDMDALFGGKTQADQLRHEIAPLQPHDRETNVVARLRATFNSVAKCVQDFRFVKPNGQTSHYLFYACKHIKGLTIIKQIMAPYSSANKGGVPTFEFCRDPQPEQLSIFAKPADPIDDLASTLLRTYAGYSLTVKEIYERDSIGKKFLEQHYRDALLRLEVSAKVQMQPPASARPHRNHRATLAGYVRVQFP